MHIMNISSFAMKNPEIPTITMSFEPFDGCFNRIHFILNHMGSILNQYYCNSNNNTHIIPVDSVLYQHLLLLLDYYEIPIKWPPLSSQNRLFAQ